MRKGTRSETTEKERALVRDLYPGLRRFAAVVAPAELDPDDLVHEALLRALEREGLHSLDHPTAYLRKTMLNLASNHRRRMGRRRRALGRVVVPDGFQEAYPSDVSELLRLSPKARAVLYMTTVEGRPYAEAAAVLGCSEVSVRAAASRGKRQLRSALSEEVRNESA